MPGAWTNLSIKDGLGTTRTMRAWDESGTGVGPYSFGQVLADGLGGAVTVTGGALNVTSASSGTKTIKTVSGSLAADTDVIAAVTSKRIKVISYSIITTGINANAAIFKSNGTGGTELWRVILQAPAAASVYGANLAIAAPSFLFATVAGEKLTLDVGNADTVHYSIAYFDDDAT